MDFGKNHSHIDTIFKFTTELQLNKYNKYNTIALYIDFKKAFDTVNHEILLEKLKTLKIKHKVLSWVKLIDQEGHKQLKFMVHYLIVK